MNEKIKVLFVCMGNICRSPMAEGVFRHLVQQQKLSDVIVTDSAGTHAYHIGEPPDNRAQAMTLSQGIDICDLRARRVNSQDFEDYHYVLAMDKDNYVKMECICPAGRADRLMYFLQFAPQLNKLEVPDPYYGGNRGFKQVFTLVEAASHGLLKDIRRNYLSRLQGE